MQSSCFRPLLMRWGITWECVTISKEKIPKGRIAMATWITQTAQTTGPLAAVLSPILVYHREFLSLVLLSKNTCWITIYIDDDM